MRNFISISLVASLFCSIPALAVPVTGVLGVPQQGKTDTHTNVSPLKYYRIGVLVNAKTFNSKEVCDEAVTLFSKQMTEEILDKYIVKSIKNDDGTYSVALLLRVIFFDKAEAEKAKKLLESYQDDHPDLAKEKFLVVEDSQA